MLDEFAKSAMVAAATPRVAAPEMFATAFNEAQRPFLPFIAVHRCGIDEIDGIILHKGLLHRLGAPLVEHVHRTWTPTFANEVYIVYAREAVDVPDGDRAEIARHLGPVEDFLRRPKATVRPGRPKRATIVSAYGVGNVGDDLVSLASQRMLLDIGLEEVRLTGPTASLEDIEWCDVVALGGGGLFYDSSLQNVVNYLWPLQAAKAQHKPFVALGIGTQGIKTELGREVYGRLLPHADLISVRAPKDEAALLACNPRLDNLFVGNDMAFYLARDLAGHVEPAQPRRRRALYSLSVVQTGLPYARLANATIERLRSIDYEVVLMLHSERDRAAFEMIGRNHGLEIVETAEIGAIETARLYRQSKLAVTTRFHGLIISILMGTPVVAIYSPLTKNGGLLTSAMTSLLACAEHRPTFSLTSFLAKLETARAADPGQVEACIAGTMSIKDKVAEVLGLARVR